MAFKGGTSLSKCYNIIRRFSEDIDLILDWGLVGCRKDEPWEERSRNQQDKYNKAVNARTEVFLRNEFAPKLQDDFREILGNGTYIRIDSNDPQTVCFAYPRLFDEGSILPEIRLEAGALAAWTPTRKAQVRPFVAEQFPQVFANERTLIRTASPERTFWEKVTILHKEAFRTNGIVPDRYSRHYYDMWCLASCPVKQSALNDLDLMGKVVAFKDRFYHSGTARYELAKPGSLRLMPPRDCLRGLKDDYDNTKDMIFGEKPDFDVMLSAIYDLEKEINSLERGTDRKGNEYSIG